MDRLVEYVMGDEARSPSSRRAEFQTRAAIGKRVAPRRPKEMNKTIGELLDDLQPISADANNRLL